MNDAVVTAVFGQARKQVCVAVLHHRVPDAFEGLCHHLSGEGDGKQLAVACFLTGLMRKLWLILFKPIVDEYEGVQEEVIGRMLVAGVFSFHQF